MSGLLPRSASLAFPGDMVIDASGWIRRSTAGVLKRLELPVELLRHFLDELLTALHGRVERRLGSSGWTRSREVSAALRYCRLADSSARAAASRTVAGSSGLSSPFRVSMAVPARAMRPAAIPSKLRS
jgi:hypothetical protein